MPPRIELRRFRAVDVNRILEIEEASFGRDAWDRDLFLDYFRRCPDLFLIAKRGRRIAGYSITCLGRGRAELVSLAVDPRDRQHGIGQTLFEATLAVLRSLGVKEWWLMVGTDNDPAIRLYESNGFVRARRAKGYYGARRDAWRMRLTI